MLLGGGLPNFLRHGSLFYILLLWEARAPPLGYPRPKWVAPQPPLPLPMPPQERRHRLPPHLWMVSRSIFYGLHYEYRLEETDWTTIVRNCPFIDTVDQDYTLVTIPNVGHWAYHEAPDLVTDTMKW